MELHARNSFRNDLPLSGAPVWGPVHGIDRVLGNVETGHFERSLSALTAVGSVITAAEIHFEHDKASFGDPWMWAPVVLGPVGAVAGVAGIVQAGEGPAAAVLPGEGEAAARARRTP